MRAIVNVTVMVATLLGAAPPAIALEDPTITCDSTNDPWGSKELCYTGPRSPKSALARSQDNQFTTDAIGNVRAHHHPRAVTRHR